MTVFEVGKTPRSIRFWSADDFVPQHREHEDVEGLRQEFLALFSDAIRNHWGQRPWTQLSGGLDSTSITCTAQTMFRRGVLENGVQGTITILDSTRADRTAYHAAAAIAQYGLRNETITGYWAWRTDGEALPLTSNPSIFYPYYARERAMWRILQQNHASSLLSGVGADELFGGRPLYLLDLLISGRFAAAARGLRRWAQLARASLWLAGYKQFIFPWLPYRLKLRLKPEVDAPLWIRTEFRRRHHLRERLRFRGEYEAPLGRKFHGSVVNALNVAHFAIHGFAPKPPVPIHYPFLYRPLVEFCLRLPGPLRSDPRGSKWLLREAMRGILPEQVRNRSTKDDSAGSFLYALSNESKLITQLLREPILADLGVIEPGLLRKSVEEARAGRCQTVIFLLAALSLETWLAARMGRKVDEYAK